MIGLAARGRRQIRALAKSTLWKVPGLGAGPRRHGPDPDRAGGRGRRRPGAGGRRAARRGLHRGLPRGHDAPAASCCGRAAASAGSRSRSRRRSIVLVAIEGTTDDRPLPAPAAHPRPLLRAGAAARRARRGPGGARRAAPGRAARAGPPGRRRSAGGSVPACGAGSVYLPGGISADQPHLQPRDACVSAAGLLGRLQVEGLEALPATGPVLLVGNHDSQWDPIMVGLAARRRRQILALAKSSLWESPASLRYSMGWARSRSTRQPLEAGRGPDRDRDAARRSLRRCLRRGHGFHAAAVSRAAAESAGWPSRCRGASSSSRRVPTGLPAAGPASGWSSRPPPEPAAGGDRAPQPATSCAASASSARRASVSSLT